MSDHYFQILPAATFSRTPCEDEIERYLADLRAMMFEAIALAPKMIWVGPVPVDSPEQSVRLDAPKGKA